MVILICSQFNRNSIYPATILFVTLFNPYNFCIELYERVITLLHIVGLPCISHMVTRTSFDNREYFSFRRYNNCWEELFCKFAKETYFKRKYWTNVSSVWKKKSHCILFAMILPYLSLCPNLDNFFSLTGKSLKDFQRLSWPSLKHHL